MKHSQFATAWPRDKDWHVAWMLIEAFLLKPKYHKKTPFTHAEMAYDVFSAVVRNRKERAAGLRDLI